MFTIYSKFRRLRVNIVEFPMSTYSISRLSEYEKGNQLKCDPLMREIILFKTKSDKIREFPHIPTEFRKSYTSNKTINEYSVFNSLTFIPIVFHTIHKKRAAFSSFY